MNKSLLDKANENIKKNLQRVAKKQFKDNESSQTKFVEETLTRLNGSVDVNSTVKNTDLVIEAIIENIKIKHELFAAIDKVSSRSI